jgi:hypothetical protein
MLTAHGYQVGRATPGASPGWRVQARPAGETSIVIAAVNGVERSYHHSAQVTPCTHMGTHGTPSTCGRSWSTAGTPSKRIDCGETSARQVDRRQAEAAAAPATNTAGTPGAPNGAGEDGYAGFLSDLGNGARLARLHGREVALCRRVGLAAPGTAHAGKWTQPGKSCGARSDTARTLFEEGTSRIAASRTDCVAQTMRDSVSEDARQNRRPETGGSGSRMSS